ncbi:DNA (cytosine-5-)-methyltransferase [Oceanispirochaeta crateris]|uniref:Cytosine-specific methyltransferase n=1 Tax=Oceanispirochaeta crateris TaxID=2518645 RepID=A0A5C1QID0_9SPIO|nr:DNA (cytosine-5-)-methyltransferase [Oceanispirochaeta crateris]QEN07331.1 DNA (cytosine-5-)-methyltransferase [Oceanispirochaeta crateris]
MSKEFTVGSLFAGIGGICSAFKGAGAKVIWANEFDKKACETYRHNFKDTTLYEEDIHNLKTEDVSNVDIITSGFPCQAFSIAGYRQGFNDKKGRGNLFFETARFIDKIRPEAYLLENVKNLANHDNGNTLSVIKKTIINDLEYSFIPFILNSKDYGNIPQTRERIYIVGFKNEANFNTESDVDNELRSSKFQIPTPIKLTNIIADLLDHDKKDDRFYYNKDHQYYPVLNAEMKRRDTIYQWRRVYVRENKSNVCPTLTANMGTGGHNVPLIIDNYGYRKLTPQECIRFQGFSDGFKFPENMALSHCYKQAGNSVVVPVVQRIAEEIIRVLRETELQY